MRLARIFCAALTFFCVAVAADDFNQWRDAVARGDYSAAVPALQAAAEHDDPRAIGLLASLYQQGRGFPHDVAKAHSLYIRAAELGDADAQFSLGNIYLLGDGVSVDEAWALTYFRQAAAQGHVGAARNLDELYRASGLSPAPASVSPAARLLPEQAARLHPPPAVDGAARAPRMSAAAHPLVARASTVRSHANVEVPSSAPPPPTPGDTPAGSRANSADTATGAPSDDELRAIELARAGGIEVVLDDHAMSPAVPVTQIARLAPANAGLEGQPAFTPSSSAGDPDTVENTEEGTSAYQTAQRYLRGQGVPRDAATGIQWLQRAARAGHMQAKYELALRYLNGQDVIADDAMAITLLRDAAQAGHSLARAQIKQVYAAAGLPMPDLTRPQLPVAPLPAGDKSTVTAPTDAAQFSPTRRVAATSSISTTAAPASLVSRPIVAMPNPLPPVAAAGRNSDGQLSGRTSEHHGTRGAVAGIMADAGAEEESDLAGLAAASADNAPATLADARAALAVHDLARAASIFTALADRGDAEAQAHIGYMTDQGEGVVADKAKAVQWYRKAALQGNRDAQYNLAVALAFGDGVARNDAEALQWYRRAAEQGSAVAQYSLGVSYALGDGAAQSDREAIKWYRAAAEQGYVDAQYNLGDMLRAGKGAPAGEREALHWYREAARNGNASAQCALGNIYRDGTGVERDRTEAMHWYKLAAAQGHREAQAGLASLQARR